VPYQVRHYGDGRKKRGILESILKAIWWLISLPFRMMFGKSKGGSSAARQAGGLDRNFIHNKWREIESLMKLGSPSNYSRAVIESDKLLDHVLRGYRAPGMTMGDRLKASKNRFSPEGYNAAWQGHKVRNEIVHNSQYELMDYQAKDATANFKKALDELL
jgi:hypothetical protein